MTREDITRMAREVGILDFRDEDGSEYVKDVLDDLERFASLVASAEREACAKVCVGISNAAVACSIKHSGNRDKTLAFFNNSCAAEACADAIRARSTP